MGCVSSSSSRKVHIEKEDVKTPASKSDDIVIKQDVILDNVNKDIRTSRSYNDLSHDTKVEVFLNAALRQCGQVLTLKTMLENPGARAAFEKFSKSEFAEENIVFLSEIEKIKRGDANELIPRIQALSDNFLKPGCATEININHKMKNDILNNISSENNDKLLASLAAAENEIISIMALGVLPRFLKSKFYIEWRILESNGPSYKSKHVPDNSKLLQSNGWLNTFFQSAELLPICITLATANKNRPGFPLIYVNKHFETITGYLRSDIIGTNCKFLQSKDTEPESISMLSNALKNALPVKCCITNYRKDGAKFENLLSMKPIFDQDGIYRYVLGIQFDSFDQRSNPAKLIISDALLNLIPDNIIYNGEDM